MKVISKKSKGGKNRKIRINLKSIRGKILLSIISIALISAISLGTVSSVLNYKSTLETVEVTLTGAAEITSDVIESRINEIKTVAEEIGQLTLLTQDGVSNEEKARLFKIRIDKYGYLDAYMTDKNGMAVTTVSKKI